MTNLPNTDKVSPTLGITVSPVTHTLDTVVKNASTNDRHLPLFVDIGNSNNNVPTNITPKKLKIIVIYGDNFFLFKISPHLG